MSNYLFKGPFAEHIENHVSLKKAIGYKYEAEARHLLRFSSFTEQKYPEATMLTKEIVLDWCLKKSYEAQANQCTRASILRQLAIYMDSVEIGAYVLPKGYYPTEEQYVPHIYTENELQRFFHETDQCHYVSECPYRHLIMPVFFRMVYSCGLRSSEARLLKVSDVNLETGILSIHHSKKDNSRLVPMSDELTERCRNYSANVHMFLKETDWFFPGLNGKPMTLGNVYHNFRRFLWRVGISHGGRGKGPRVQDFSYPNLNKIQTFFKKARNSKISVKKGLDFIFYFFIDLTPQNPASPPFTFFHFFDTFLSFSSSSVARAFNSCSKVISI